MMHTLSHNSVREKQINPSFSSSVLDEIYYSMDAADDKSSEFKLREDKLSTKNRVSGIGGKNLTIRTTRSSMPESHQRSIIDDGPFFCGSVQSSSDSSSRYASDSVGFRIARKPSGFAPSGSKPVRMESNYCLNNNCTNNTVNWPFVNSKARALKIYANLKKLKQPISPGGRLRAFLNSLLSSRHLKKPKDLNQQKIETTSKSTHGSTCSSASLFTKSCLSKNSPRSREKLKAGVRRTVRFYPVSVIVDEDCRPCGEKFIYTEQDFMNVHVSAMRSENKFVNDDEENDSDDKTSDASSDLFELNHLSNFQELPVFETTYLTPNVGLLMD